MNDWVYLYLSARYIRVIKECRYTYVYEGEKCILNKENNTNEVNIFIDKFDYNDLKAIMEVI